MLVGDDRLTSSGACLHRLTRTDCPHGGDKVEIGKGAIYCQFGTTELDPQKLPRAVLYFFIISFIKWVGHIEQYADFTFRVEDTTMYTICMQTGLPAHRCAPFKHYQRGGRQRHSVLKLPPHLRQISWLDETAKRKRGEPPNPRKRGGI